MIIETQTTLVKVEIWFGDGLKTWSIAILPTIEHFQEERETFRTINYISKFANFFWWFQVQAKSRHFGTQIKLMKVQTRFRDG